MENGSVLIGAFLGVGLLIWAVLAATKHRAVVEQLTREVRRAQQAAAADRDAAMESALRQVLAANEAMLTADRVRGAEQTTVIHGELAKVATLVRNLDKDRAQGYGELREAVSRSAAQVTELSRATQGLREALASTKARGQWGERMAEDVLHLAGFVENLNYRKQRAIAGAGTIPDFTFLLPNDLLLNMDVKFPLDNYLRWQEADSELDGRRFADKFRSDVRKRVKEVTTREYIDPAGQTLDFVLLFIPNEQLYACIHELDPELLEDAVRQRVVMCSPLTLFAVLALIRQMVDNLQLARTSNEILQLLGEFTSQWDRFTVQMDQVGKRIDAAQKEHETLIGTRRRMLERPLHKIDALRSSRDSTSQLAG